MQDRSELDVKWYTTMNTCCEKKKNLFALQLLTDDCCKCYKIMWPAWVLCRCSHSYIYMYVYVYTHTHTQYTLYEHNWTALNYGQQCVTVWPQWNLVGSIGGLWRKYITRIFQTKLFPMSFLLWWFTWPCCVWSMKDRSL